MNIWAFRPDIVDANSKIFAQQYNDNVKIELVAAGDYNSVVEEKLITKVPMDVFYSGGQYYFRAGRAGWIEDLNTLPDADAIKKDMYPNFLDWLTSSDGRLLGLVYFFEVKCPLANMDILEKAGLADTPPTNYEEIFDQCREIKKKGIVQYPLLADWNPVWNDGPYELYSEYMNSPKGGELFDPKTFEPIFDTNTYLADLLASWKAAYDDNLCTKDIFTLSWGDRQARFSSGQHAFLVCDEPYDMPTYNDPTRSKIAGKASLVPLGTGPDACTSWGTGLIGSYCMTKKDRGPEKTKRVNEFMEFFGWKDKDGNYRVAKEWALQTNLQSGIPAVAEDPDVVKSFISNLPYRKDKDYAILLDITSKCKQPKWFTQYWAIEFIYSLGTWSTKAVSGTVSIKDAITGMRTDAENLIKQYQQ
jgi:ABC-type glycerol-3-phosphate transport system substrate-binding protein